MGTYPNKLDADYWNHRFEKNDTPWDMGHVSDPIKNYIDQLTNKNISILIPGCGNSYEAGYLLQNGFTNLTVIDISPILTARLEEKYKQYAGKQLHIITGNFFDLKGQFNLILEQTFFCALEPSQRSQYCIQMHLLLKPTGKLAGLLFNRQFSNPGPPFGGSMEEYRQLFSVLFRIIKLEACYNSIKSRYGSECFFMLQKR